MRVLKNKTKVLTKKTKKLTNTELKNILNLKSTHYKFSYKKQKEWFLKNINNIDRHNLLIYKNKIIGYNCLRYLKVNKINLKNSKKMILFDTLIINSKFRGLGASYKLMLKNLKQLSNKNIIGLLYCKLNMIPFYNKFNWNRVQKKQIKFNIKMNKDLFPMLISLNKKELKKAYISVETI